MHCEVCEEEVPYNRIVRDLNSELTCQYCGFVLHTGPVETFTRAECILAAEGDPAIREVLREAITKGQLAKEVEVFENGIDCVTVFTQRLAKKKPAEIVILDLEMPQMDGVKAARVIRFIETQYHSDRKHILFISSQKADTGLKKKLSEFLPASYLHKEFKDDPNELIERVGHVIGRILKKKKDSKS